MKPQIAFTRRHYTNLRGNVFICKEILVQLSRLELIKINTTAPTVTVSSKIDQATIQQFNWYISIQASHSNRTVKTKKSTVAP